MDDELVFAEEEEKQISQEVWNVLVVDDDESIHAITILALKHKLFDGKALNIISAMSAAEAKEILNNRDDIALALIDVVMETPEAGLELVNYIRHELNNKMIRLVLRTGQSSQAPEEHVINFYDINDYKEKTELTVQKLYTLVRTSLKQYEQFKELKANHDTIYNSMTTSELTGLPNRIKLNEDLDSEGEKSLILINIDNFSSINETKGFDFGDKLLKSFATYIDNSYNKHVKLFHIHADMFVLLCFEFGDKEIMECITNLKINVKKHTFLIDTTKQHVTVSIGIAMHESGNLMQKAELAIKEAREIGTNFPQVYNDDLNIVRTIYANSLWSDRVRDALGKNKIYAYFQAIKNLKTQEIIKYEALVRIEHDNEIFRPDKFLDAALYSGQIYDIFKFMLEQTCKMAQQNNYAFSINVSESDLIEPSFFSILKQHIEDAKIEPSRIILEILEYKNISEQSDITQLINKIHNYGVKIAIDDFGVKCSNFSQLNNIPIDFIKIDGSFIKDIVQNKNSQVITSTILNYAHKTNVKVVAEYVCDKDIYKYVKELGIDFAQGYFISKPSAALV